MAEHDPTQPHGGDRNPEEQPTGPLPTPEGDVSQEVFSGGQGEPLPKQIGRYRIVGQIGRGGMGAIYLGVHEEGRFQKRAAIKVVRKGMDTEDVLRRFELERQLLSALNHPNIARLYDGGSTEDGRPYFAMEFIEGLPVDRYCDRNRSSIEERLDLFRQVCSAVAYAHRNLVVHRDIKPSNIIVTEEGVPKLLDFGIAKLLNPEIMRMATHVTAPELRIMTPEYASPEQVRGERITTASDVYSLGVLLYELLTGRRPYRIRENVRAEIERIICEEEPERPSAAVTRIEEALAADSTPIVESGTSRTGSRLTTTPEAVSRSRGLTRPESLRRRLAGDLDNIILMAMRKEPQRRYTSIERFVEDIDRHLQGMPVTARPSSFGYRAAKFVRRNRAGVAMAALVTITVVGGLAVLWQRAEIEAERLRVAEAQAQVELESARAEHAEARAAFQETLASERATNLRRLIAFTIDDVDGAMSRVEGALKSRRLLLTAALGHLQTLATELGDEPGVMRELAHGYARVGDMLGGRRGPSVGDTEGALRSYAEALSIRRELAEKSPDDPRALAELWNAHVRMGDALVRAGDTAGAREHYEAGLTVSSRMLELDPQGVVERRTQTVALQNIADLLVNTGDTEAGLAAYERILAIRRELVAEHPEDEGSRRDLTVTLGRVGAVHEHHERFDEAIAAYREAMDIRRQDFEQRRDARTIDDLARPYYWLSRAMLKAGDVEQARQHLIACLSIVQARAEDDPHDSRVQTAFVRAFEEAGNLLAENGDLDGALEHYSRFQTLMQQFSERDALNVLYRKSLARSHALIAHVKELTGEVERAIAGYRAAIEATSELIDLNPTDALLAQALTGYEEALARLTDGREP